MILIDNHEIGNIFVDGLEIESVYKDGILLWEGLISNFITADNCYIQSADNKILNAYE